MTHNFTTLSSVLGRCSAKVADQVIAEIRSAINDAVVKAATATEVDTLLTPVQTTVEATQNARREKAAARRAAKKAATADSAERSESPRCGSVAKRKLSGAEAPDARLESCGEAEAELPVKSPSPLGEGGGEAFTIEMVKYLRRCPDQYMLAVLNSYFHLIFTGNLVHTADDHRYLDNFITLTRTVGLIDNPEPPTAEQATAFLLDNPALPLPRAQRRAIERMRRKQLRHTSHLK